ncbi:HAMP domain-containing sensor histidine kinase [Nonomuraea sp. NPDC048916]|uniref:sensor histidine kinase n=1 Tax=Nonomuraea sp. NPDC048916 TaxID=3154232 RepID=UPI0033F298B4
MIATLVAAVVFCLAAVLTLTTAPANLRGVVQSRVELAVQKVASDVRAGQLSGILDTPARVQLLQVVSADGRVLAVSEGQRAEPGLAAIRPATDETLYTTERTLKPPEEPRGDYLVMAMRVRGPRGPVTVYGVGSLTDVQRALLWLYVLVFAGTPLVVVLVGGLTWLMVGQALRPVERIRAELAEITGQDLTRRVPVPDTGDEITHLATTTNDTLDRLERSAETQRRFVADASHELRSPVSGLRAQLEYAATYPEEADWQATGVRALAAADRLTGIIDDLLILARLDAGATTDRRVVDLCDQVRDQVKRRAGGRVPIYPDLCEAAPVLGSPVQTDRLLTNLLDNAARHAKSRIDLTMEVDDGEVVLTITDDGAGIAPEDRERVFERFTRLKEARLKDKAGSGLGLSLSREIATAHGGTLTITDHQPGAQFVLRLPMHRAA